MKQKKTRAKRAKKTRAKRAKRSKKSKTKRRPPRLMRDRGGFYVVLDRKKHYLTSLNRPSVSKAAKRYAQGAVLKKRTRARRKPVTKETIEQFRRDIGRTPQNPFAQLNAMREWFNFEQGKLKLRLQREGEDRDNELRDKSVQLVKNSEETRMARNALKQNENAILRKKLRLRGATVARMKSFIRNKGAPLTTGLKLSNIRKPELINLLINKDLAKEFISGFPELDGAKVLVRSGPLGDDTPRPTPPSTSSDSSSDPDATPTSSDSSLDPGNISADTFAGASDEDPDASGETSENTPETITEDTDVRVKMPVVSRLRKKSKKTKGGGAETSPEQLHKATKLDIPLWSTQIEAFMRDAKPAFLGVISRDQIMQLVPDFLENANAKRPSCFVMNLDKSTGPGTHWVGVFIDLDKSKSVEYNDSFGEEPPPGVIQDLSKLVDLLRSPCLFKFKINRIAYQENDSVLCGWHAMKFLRDRLAGKPFKEATIDQSKKGEGAVVSFKEKFSYI